MAVICIEDPIRDEAADVIRTLKELGFAKVVMMTGDSERTAWCDRTEGWRGRVLF